MSADRPASPRKCAPRSALGRQTRGTQPLSSRRIRDIPDRGSSYSTTAGTSKQLYWKRLVRATRIAPVHLQRRSSVPLRAWPKNARSSQMPNLFRLLYREKGSRDEQVWPDTEQLSRLRRAQADLWLRSAQSTE